MPKRHFHYVECYRDGDSVVLLERWFSGYNDQHYAFIEDSRTQTFRYREHTIHIMDYKGLLDDGTREQVARHLNQRYLNNNRLGELDD